LIIVSSTCVSGVLPDRWFGPEKVSDLSDIGCAVAISVEAIVTDAVLAFGKDVDQEPSNEL